MKKKLHHIPNLITYSVDDVVEISYLNNGYRLFHNTTTDTFFRNYAYQNLFDDKVACLEYVKEMLEAKLISINQELNNEYDY